MPLLVYQIFSILLLVLGFGFVVFFHELGHFLAAKWMGVKVEQFAVGMGHAICSWRSGLGFRWGSTGREHQARLNEKIEQMRKEGVESRNTNAAPTWKEVDAATAALGLGETEYRLSWIPIGGYVKMLGQDDMDPNATSEDPRSFDRKSIGARMVVISAGVIMNVILAGLLFMSLFLIGYKVPPAMVGDVVPGSPAQHAVLASDPKKVVGLQVGDRILMLDGQWQHDFGKLRLNIALMAEGQDVPVVVQHPDGTVQTLLVHARRASDNRREFLEIGIGHAAYPLLKGLDAKLLETAMKRQPAPDRATQIFPGDKVTHVAGQAVTDQDYYVLDRAVQAAKGQPVPVKVTDVAGKEQTVNIKSSFDVFFGKPFDLAGLQPRTVIGGTTEGSPAKDKLKAGDIVLAIRPANGAGWTQYPSHNELLKAIKAAQDAKAGVDVRVERDGKAIDVLNLAATHKVRDFKKGLGVSLGYDVDHAVISVMDSAGAASAPATTGATATSPATTNSAAMAGIPRGAKIVSIDGTPVANWFDIHRLLSASGPGAVLSYVSPDDQAGSATLAMTGDHRQKLADVRYSPIIELPQKIEPRKTNNPLIAAGWGVTETRDMLLQFYVTIQRAFQGTVDARNFMGPVGIFGAGAQFAFKGTDWLIWFLAMISANLAVVNFLPIPIVDGGHFVFLIIEKVQGKPLSARMRTVAQMVGLAILVSLIVFVTYNDIRRFF